MADIFDDVDAAVQREKFIAWWHQYGNSAIGLLLAVVIAVGVNNWWQNHERAKLAAQTEQLLNVLLPIQGEAVKPDAATATLKNLQAHGDKQLDVLSTLQLASRLENDGKNAEAAAMLKPLMTRRYTEKILQDLATVQYVRLTVADAALSKATSAADLLALLKPLTAGNRPFRYSALELQALILQQDGKTQDAQNIFKALSDDQIAPASLRTRAQAYVVTSESVH